MDRAMLAHEAELFAAPCTAAMRCGGSCGHAVFQSPAYGGRWFVRFGHRNFNSRANNGIGYSSRRAALAAARRSVVTLADLED